MSTPPPPPPPPPVEQPPAGGYNYAPAAPLSPSDQRLWATLTHIAGIFFSVLPALIAHLVLKERGAFVAEHTKTALNFQLTVLIAYIVSGFLWLAVIGIFLTIAIGVLVVVFSIIAAVKANAGELYQYPLTIRFIR